MSEQTVSPGTDPEVAKILERLYRSQQRVRLWYGNPETGKAWLEEHDVMGYIGRSTGEQKVPLLVCRSNSTGGYQINTENIVRVDTTRGVRLYRHPAFHTGLSEPEIAFVDGGEGEPEKYRFCVTRNGDPVGYFPSIRKARRWVEFMRGERYAK